MNKEFIKVTKKIDKRKKDKQDKIVELSANRKKIDLCCSRLYISFDKLKQPFLLNFDYKTNMVDFNKFIPEIQENLNKINKYILFNIFDNNEFEWDMSYTEDWLLDCFFRTKENNEIKVGCIIELLSTQNFQNDFCSFCKNTLTDNIVKQIKYLLRNKRYNDNNNISIEENDHVKELQDLKDYIDDIVTWQAYVSFKKVLNKTESLIFDIALFVFYKQKTNITREEIAKELKISERTVYRSIESIQNKWNQYKIDNNLK